MPISNDTIAERLEAFATLLELSEASPYAARAYRRAAETVRGTRASVEELARDGRVEELRGVGPGIARRIEELVETGAIAELDELERSVRPELVAFGRLLGFGARRMTEIARALDVGTPDELRAAAAAGRLRSVPGIGPKTEAQLLARLERPAERPRKAVPLNRARVLVGALAESLGGEPAGDPRRWSDECHALAVVVAAEEAVPVLEAFAAHPSVLTLVEREARRAVGVTVDGVSVELVVAPTAEAGTALLRATGTRAYVDALGPLPPAPTESALYA
ncbi:MAG TPA: helix-hairpin-helix domain-containing protein, partial [Gaiella sp.]|nr:helix-hairpin-helix domain-containing protein [Gaiella sp.]